MEPAPTAIQKVKSMSRSRKKFPVFKDNPDAGEKKSWKKISARKYRRTFKPDENVTRVSNKEYHKHVDQWYVCDYRFYCPEYLDKDNKDWYKILIK